MHDSAFDFPGKLEHALDPVLHENVVGLQSFFTRILAWVPGFVSDEIDEAALLKVLALSQFSIPIGGDRFTSAAKAVIDSATLIFPKGGLVRIAAVQLLTLFLASHGHGTSIPVPTPVPVPTVPPLLNL